MASDNRVDGALLLGRTAAAAELFGAVLLACAAAAFRTDPRADFLAAPAALAGIVAPAVGYRLYGKMRQTALQEQGRARRMSRFTTATLLSLACTELAAVLGIVVFFLSGRTICLIGLAMHALLTGAIWPSHEKLESFLEGDPGGGV